MLNIGQRNVTLLQYFAEKYYIIKYYVSTIYHREILHYYNITQRKNTLVMYNIRQRNITLLQYYTEKKYISTSTILDIEILHH
jgi:hypothetical protein